MTDETPTQRASGEFAEAVFADPEVLDWFKRMAKESAEREGVPDDFSSWVPREIAAVGRRREGDETVAREQFLSDLRRASRPVDKRAQSGS